MTFFWGKKTVLTSMILTENYLCMPERHLDSTEECHSHGCKGSPRDLTVHNHQDTACGNECQQVPWLFDRPLDL